MEIQDASVVEYEELVSYIMQQLAQNEVQIDEILVDQILDLELEFLVEKGLAWKNFLQQIKVYGSYSEVKVNKKPKIIVEKEISEVELYRGSLTYGQYRKNILSMCLLVKFKKEAHLVFKVPPTADWDYIKRSINKKEALKVAFLDLQAENVFFNGVFDNMYFDDMDDLNLNSLIMLIDNIAMSYPIEGLANSVLDFLLNREGLKASIVREPNALRQLLVEVLQKKDGAIYDGTAGMNSLLLDVYNFANKNIHIFGQEINEESWAIGIIMLAIHDINETNATIFPGNTLKEPKFIENGQLMTFDGIVSDIPFSLKNWGEELAESDPYKRYVYGAPPKSSADWAFISHYIASLKEDGKAVILVPHGVLFRGAKEGKIRKAVIEQDLIEAVIGLPANLLLGTSLPLAILVINKNKALELHNKVLIIHAEECFERQGIKNTLRDEDVVRIVDTYTSLIEEDGFSTIVKRDQLLANDYNLLPIRYFNQVEVETELGTAKILKQSYEAVQTVQLDRIADVQRGFNVTAKDSDEYVDTFVVNLSDVTENEILIEQLKPISLTEKQQQSYLLQECDLLISSRGTKQTKFIVVPKTEKKMIFTNNFVRLRLRHLEEWDPTYLKIFLESPIGQYYVKSSQTGSLVSVLSAKDIEKLTVPVLPIEKQRAIVTQYEQAQKAYKEAVQKAEQQRIQALFSNYEQMGIQHTFELQEKE